MLHKLAIQIHENNKSKGFYDSEKNIGEMLCLIHSEVSEALEADRENRYYKNIGDNQQWFIRGLADPNYGASFCGEEAFLSEFKNSVKNTFEDELADVIIRVLDLCAFKGIDIESHIKAKMRYNSLRPHKHGKNY